MKTLLVSIVVGALLAVPQFGQAQVADVAAGKARAAGACDSCHGMDGIGRNERWPNLAGQNDAYMIKQLKAFREGSRKDSFMTPMARPLTDQAIRELAAYYSSLPRQYVSDAANGNRAAGEHKAAATCVECHGAQDGSPNPEWPTLAGQKVDYLVKQMRKFRDGVRTDPLMSPAAQSLSDEDINDLAAYYAGLKP
jgi:cytochrome c553